MFEIVRYTSEHIDEWNTFVAKSKNGTFLFDRYYMDYHSDRFKDHSLMFYKQNRLYALLPANDDGKGTLWSHQGLTIGGLIMNEKSRTEDVCDLFLQLNSYLQSTGFHRVVYKTMPWHYCLLPSQEDLYAITTQLHATIKARNIASVIDLSRPTQWSRDRKYGLNVASRNDITINKSEDFEEFWLLLEANLMNKYHAHPVHSVREIELLRSRFPDNIRLFCAFQNDKILGGTILYQTPQVVHTQYISASAEGKRMRVLDMLFYHLTQKVKWQQRYFDFGTSNMPGSSELHASLIHQKEGFGARAVCYDTYEWEIPIEP